MKTKKTLSLIAIWLLCVSVTSLAFVNMIARASSAALSVFPSDLPKIDGVATHEEWGDDRSMHRQ